MKEGGTAGEGERERYRGVERNRKRKGEWKEVERERGVEREGKGESFLVSCSFKL